MDILSKIQTELNAPKNQRNNFGNYNYRSCEDILEGLKPLLKETETSIVLSDKIIVVGDRVYVEATATLWKGKDVLGGASASAREPLQQKGMNEAQITGATSSYARKYALNGLFAIDDNKDADTDEHHKTVNKPNNKPVSYNKDPAFIVRQYLNSDKMPEADKEGLRVKLNSKETVPTMELVKSLEAMYGKL